MEERGSTIIISGDSSQGGAYILRVRLREDTRLRFGRFKQGKVVALPAGEYAYVGSALAGLAPRLVRHATRSGRKGPHRIRAEVVERFREAGLGGAELLPKSPKKKHWHIDYLLDLETAELTGVLVVRSEERLEPALAGMLEGDPHARVIEKGLGAGDAAGSTHLLRVVAGEEWWAALAARLGSLQNQACAVVGGGVERYFDGPEENLP